MMHSEVKREYRGERADGRVATHEEEHDESRSHPPWKDARPPNLGWRRRGQHFVRETIQGPVRVPRLVSLDRQREVIFSDRVPRFEELMGLVESMLPPQAPMAQLHAASPGDGRAVAARHCRRGGVPHRAGARHG